ncbi:MAG TPA: serine/threonine-protein kinase [Ktedonobacteraceae bacterium]|jgi:serine/threonine protein kinase
MADLIGHTFGQYHLTALLGSGGFADVYLGEHMRLGMQAAVKLLHAQLADSEVAHFQEEARIIAELIHPHIIRVLDFDVQNHIPFLVLDYAPNGSLRQRHQKGEQVPQDLVVSYLTQIADALHYAHRSKRIHRDVKPENMLVGRQGEILLSDFGIASVAHSTSSMHTEVPLGTLAYMAPEQLQGHPRPASDQYALAICTYQWLCATMPFHGSSAEIIGQHIGHMPPPLHSKVPAISPEVEAVVMRALAKEPGERFPSIEAFAVAFARACKGQGEQTTLPTATTLPEPEQRPSTPVASGQAANAPTLRDTQAAAYVRPSVPYIPPEEPAQHPGWAIFWRGLVLAAAFCLLSFFLPDLSALTGIAIVSCGCLLGGWWGVQKTGVLSAGVRIPLWSLLWLLCFQIARIFSGQSKEGGFLSSRTSLLSTGLLLIVLAPLVGWVGGIIGGRIYRSRRPIHPPAGGSRLMETER